MKRGLLSVILLLLLIQLKASDTLTVRQVYSFSVGDTFDYKTTVANYDYNLFNTTYSRVVISQKYVSPLQDTFIYNNNWVITNLDSIAVYKADSVLGAPYCLVNFYDTSSFWGINSNEVKDCNDDGYVYANVTDSLGLTDEGNSIASNSGAYNNTQETKLVYFSDGTRQFGTPYYILAGINNVQQPADIKVFPNPANEVLNLSVTDVQDYNYKWVIYDMFGRQVQSCSVLNTETTQNILKLSAGIYTWKVLKNNVTMVSGKFVKQ